MDTRISNWQSTQLLDKTVSMKGEAVLQQENIKQVRPINRRESAMKDNYSLTQVTPPVDNLSDSTAAELDSVVEDLNKTVEALNKGLEFKVHEDTKRVIVTVVNKDTDEVIREIPPEKILDMMAKINEIVGWLVDEKA